MSFFNPELVSECQVLFPDAPPQLDSSRALTKFVDQLKESNIEDLKWLGRTPETWPTQMLSYFDHRYATAITECLNKGKLVQKMGYGFKSFKKCRLRVLSACLCQCALRSKQLSEQIQLSAQIGSLPMSPKRKV